MQNNEYIGLIGTLLGAIVGAFGSYFGTMKSLDKQMERENFIKVEQDKENKEIVMRIITKFLKEEIVDNKIIIEKEELYKHLTQGFGTQYGYNFRTKIKFDSYESVKFYLIKYSDEKMVEDIIDLYGLFYILVRYTDINQLDEGEYNKLIDLKCKINRLTDIFP
ncbi:hypothetical protein [Clostridium algidicarnis]|uniref:hypothetical protein n=1 Tax=Clostridium algidicarnis TaxID=37659 RepID=UPI001C0AD388|nr:hypothetical protein [Clostridium algidicarnis]MBU3193481.1 hypothetical protein [Clostridium algidicarnis]MBU3203113.1 hypothetical protein [Clostridium algidicarnis]MBU3211267.1 hypothetical protein [Clostridium algidicarnis]MBU3222225.1 hypothetical protein [Clostridium algidicarnis]